ncbi:hypothetical protein [Paenibacillus puerhi]|uniref:hypothetical protein n=1 Tax=Paenibacillus puerhi TaxID=2692622 RepID=UPI0013569986|nr:hypothetical protein [Paenibacillus puerhi]
MTDSDRANEGFVEEAPERKYTDFETVESARNDLTAEEFPEGPYGSDLLTESLGKSSPWRADQRSQNRFSYENRQLHAGLPRDYPGDHRMHDSSEEDEG